MYSQKQPQKYKKPLHHIPPPPSKSVNFTDNLDAAVDHEISQLTYNEIYLILNPSEHQSSDQQTQSQPDASETKPPSPSKPAVGSTIAKPCASPSSAGPNINSDFTAYLFNHS